MLVNIYRGFLNCDDLLISGYLHFWNVMMFWSTGI